MGDENMPKYATDLKDAGVVFKNMQAIADFFYEKTNENNENDVGKEIDRLVGIKSGLTHHTHKQDFSKIEEMQND